MRSISLKNKLAIFDLDGTLIDIKKRYYKVFNDFLTIKGNKMEYTIGDYISDRMKFGSDSEILLRVIGYEDSSINDFKNFKHKYIENLDYLEFDTVKPSVHDFLNILKAQGFRVELLTARRNYKNLLNQLISMNLLRHFDNVLMWPKDLYTKNEYVNLFDIDTYDIYFFGDSVDDYLAIKDIPSFFYLVNDSIIKNYFTNQESLSISEIMHLFNMEHIK